MILKNRNIHKKTFSAVKITTAKSTVVDVLDHSKTTVIPRILAMNHVISTNCITQCGMTYVRPTSNTSDRKSIISWRGHKHACFVGLRVCIARTLMAKLPVICIP